MVRKIMNIRFVLLVVFAVLLFWACDHGQLGGADQTDPNLPGDGGTDAVFQERMGFFSGVWYSYSPGIGRLDGYRIRKWSDVTSEDRARMQALFPGINTNSLVTYTGINVTANDYIIMYDDTVFGQQDDGTGGQASWGFGYIGMVRAVNIFNNDKDRGAVIIEYFQGTDPKWLWSDDNYHESSQGLTQGERPFFGIYYRVLSQNSMQMANAVDLGALYAGGLYYTEQATLEDAIAYNTVENEAELISWGIVTPQNRQ